MGFDNLGAWWLIAAVVLGVAELLVPGVFLIFLAVAAGITGAFLLLFPDMPVAAQLLSFAAWSGIAVWLGRTYYLGRPVESSDPLLNDRVARLLGETVTVVQAINGGSGRVHVGDSEWLARGPDAPVGARVRIVGADGSALRVEPVETLGDGRGA
ncbi:NfeD family protein [Sphingomonas donggukensis]|uniref:NfeD family protein n=1 Tax=Sphingomonas donggukensis TaxID=2949093 RepID=A0ABY4TVQ5_9SPHN|nr:NfeD family protein [Sphingomonas donggukensis]URW76485.1 NfeD family protein [Sphingomonas donggukensis]